MTAKRWRELYETALQEIRRESHSPPGSVYDWDDKESATMIATLRFKREMRRRIEEERAQSEAKLTAEDLREAISLGVKLAEEEALFKLTMKAKQVAELDRRPRGLRLVVDNTKIEPPQV